MNALAVLSAAALAYVTGWAATVLWIVRTMQRVAACTCPVTGPHDAETRRLAREMVQSMEEYPFLCTVLLIWNQRWYPKHWFGRWSFMVRAARH